MSVLIKKMKIPKSCRECKFRTSFHDGLDPFADWCYLTGARLGYYDSKKAKWKTEREEKCPLEEVEDEDKCEFCYVAQNYNLEDDDSPCQNCGVEE